MKTPKITPLAIPELIEAAKFLAPIGQIALSPGKLLYLDIDDRFIHALFPLLGDLPKRMPDYFSVEKSGGAHVSIIYPDEIQTIPQEYSGEEHGFTLGELVLAEFDLKKILCHYGERAFLIRASTQLPFA